MDVAWPAGVAGNWVARVGNQASEPMPLEEAKRAVVEMLKHRRKAEPFDSIARLHQLSTNAVEMKAIDRADFPRIGDPWQNWGVGK
jgi:hypothetical protein